MQNSNEKWVPLHTYTAKAPETTLLDSSLINNSKRFIESTMKVYPDGTIQVKSFKSAIMICSDNESKSGKTSRKVQHEENNIDNTYRTKSNIYDIAKSNSWTHFITLTINGNLLNRNNLEVCSKKVRKWLNNVQQRIDKDIKYLMVFETHKDGAFHFHALINTSKSVELFVDSGHKSKGRTVYNIPSFKYGFSTAIECSNSKNLASYISKYITKDSFPKMSLKGFHRYYCSRNCIKPKKYSFSYKYPIPDSAIKLWDTDFSVGYEYQLEINHGNL